MGCTMIGSIMQKFSRLLLKKLTTANRCDRTQNQGRLFDEQLSKKLDHKHKLYQLKNLIDWDNLEK